VRRKQIRRVVLGGYPITLPWVALFARGLSAYAEDNGNWIITTSPPSPTRGEFRSELDAYTLKGWPCDGAILAIGSQGEARVARRLGIPVVNMSSAVCNVGLPRVMTDDRAMGRMAADHLLERGLRHLAYLGMAGFWYSERRRAGLADRAREAGASCDIATMPRPRNSRTPWRCRMAPLDRWLQRLPRPVGLLVMHDDLSRVVVDECRRLGLNVPQEVAVIATGNDTVVCEFRQPTLSSVDRNAWRAGYEAAALLDRLMAGKDPPLHDILIPPQTVIARQSTDTVAVDDAEVAATVRFISDHLHEAFGVDRVIRQVTISRRRLELRFRNALGLSPYQYLCRARVQAAKRLLERPEHTKLQKIAMSCGFSGIEHLHDVFHRVTGTTPVEYHRQWKLHR
jgi:LacI family transcriptional regulator